MCRPTRLVSCDARAEAPTVLAKVREVATAYLGFGGRTNEAGTVETMSRIVIFGGHGNDLITDGDGSSRIDTGPGRNRVVLGSGDDEVFVGTGVNPAHHDPGLPVVCGHR